VVSAASVVSVGPAASVVSAALVVSAASVVWVDPVALVVSAV
jgi:hypothetical protein